MLPPKPNFKPRPLAPQGNHLARAVGVIYLGTQKNSFGEAFKLRLSWELPLETFEFKEGAKPEPFVVSKEMSYSMGKKSTLRPIIEGMIGTSLTDDEAYGFSVEKVLGMPCLLNLVHEDGEKGTYVGIKSATPTIKGMVCPPQINPTKILSFEKWDEEYFKSLPEFIREKIEVSPEYKKMRGGDAVAYPADEINPEDIPF